MRIKICGITRQDDARAAMQLGAWAIGFIFHPKSPRWIAPGSVRLILDDLERQGLKPERSVGVFVNASPGEIQNTVDVSGVDTVQLHGDESPEFCAAIQKLQIWKAIRLQSAEQLLVLPSFEPLVQAFLFDAAVPGQYGGTGHLTNWELFAGIQSQRPIILSGGLSPDNIQAAAALKAYAYDLSSGVELRPGIKDIQKLSKLFEQGSAS